MRRVAGLSWLGRYDDNIPPRRSGRESNSLLWMEAVGGLGEEAWRLDFDRHGYPTMQVNKTIDGIDDIVDSDEFRALTIHETLRSILTHILIVDNYHPDNNDAGGWQNDWLKFVNSSTRSTP